MLRKGFTGSTHRGILFNNPVICNEGGKDGRSCDDHTRNVSMVMCDTENKKHSEYSKAFSETGIITVIRKHVCYCLVDVFVNRQSGGSCETVLIFSPTSLFIHMNQTSCGDFSRKKKGSLPAP